MPLPSSGQISFNDVRTEVSQSSLNNYAFSGWAGGLGYEKGGQNPTYAPINVLSSGSRFSVSSQLTRSNLSMSAWYSYNHELSIATGVTGTLYQHASSASFGFVRSMLPIELGTSNATFSINVSSSDSLGLGFGTIAIYYGRPWAVNGATSSWTASAQYVAASSVNTWSYQYNYTYNASSGSKIYVVLGADVS